jgi:hypothetical protein
MNLLKWAWRILKSTKATAIIFLLLLSITINVAQFTGGLLANVSSKAFQTISGKQSIANKNALALADMNNQLDTEKKANQNLRKQLANPNTRTVTYKGRKMALSEALETTSNNMSRRAKKTASREIASMGGEALPWIGSAVIVSATVLEIKDLCDTLKDMNALKMAIKAEAMPNSEQRAVCTMVVPSKDELIASIKNTPEASWSAAKGALVFIKEKSPTVDDFRALELPEIDWNSYLEQSNNTISGLIDNGQGLLDWWNADDATRQE